MNILLHGSYIGTTGYNIHTRNLVRSFAKNHPEHTIRVRNFTVGKSFAGYSENDIHDGEEYLDDLDRELLHLQTLINVEGLSDHPIYNHDYSFKEDIHIILAETSHHYFYQEYTGFKIAYCVWETSKLHDDHFRKLNEFDQVWVVSSWHKSCLIFQGMESDKIKIVPEGIDPKIFYPIERKISKPLTFSLVGRWDYRKSTKEIVQAFKKTFKHIKDVELICLVDNPYSIDDLNSTEERLKYFELEDPKIKIEHFKDYPSFMEILRNTDVYVSCSRSEGWNLPLIECMALGIPSIYSNYSAQLEFSAGCGIPIKVDNFKLSNISKETFNLSAEGYFCEPDFNDLSKKMLDVYNNYDLFYKRAQTDSKIIHNNFTWDISSDIMYNVINELDFISVNISNYDKKTRLEIKSWLNTEELSVKFYKNKKESGTFDLNAEPGGYVWVEVDEVSWNKLIISNKNNKKFTYEK